MEIVEAIQTSIDVVRKLRELAKKVENLELKESLADLANDLADAKLAAAALKSELAEAREEARDLRDKLAQREAGKPRFEQGVYRFDGDSGNYCTACWDVSQRKVRVTELSDAFRDIGRWSCPSCKATLDG